jgi:hypothetical protein
VATRRSIAQTASPSRAFDLAADNSYGTVVMAFQVAQSDGQGQIEYALSTNRGSSWSAPAPLAESSTGHQFFPFLSASNGRVNAIWYDSRGDSNYAATRPPATAPADPHLHA